VLRKKPGDLVKLIDGKGKLFEAVLDMVSEKKCTARITHGPIEEDQPPYFLHLAVAPTKQIDRTEWMIEKSIEMGLSELSFFYSERSERTNLKMERVIKIVESAVKQSLRATIPPVNEPVSFKEFVKKKHKENKYIAHCLDLKKTAVPQIPFRSNSTLVMIGPEGDFSAEEIKLAAGHGFEGLELGKTRLRSETAGLFVCTAANVLSLT
jgi:16S rRNA (uracil1498-N3)-methyltransferase